MPHEYYLQGMGVGERNNPLEDAEAGVLLSSEKFIAQIRKKLDKRKPDEEIPPLKRLRKIIPVDKVIKVCCNYYDKFVGQCSREHPALVEFITKARQSLRKE